METKLTSDSATKAENSVKEATEAMRDNKKLPADSKMEKAADQAKDTGGALSRGFSAADDPKLTDRTPVDRQPGVDNE